MFDLCNSNKLQRMGLKNSAQVLEGLRKVAPSAFSSRIDPAHGFKTFAVDLLSIMHSLMLYCRTGNDILYRLKAMLARHKACSKRALVAPGEVESKNVVSVIAIDDYAETPRNKDIERYSRIESERVEPYVDTVELYASHTSEETKIVDLASFEYTTADNFLPKDFNRVRITNALMRKLLRFICKLIAENREELVDYDPNHIIVVDGFRDYKNLSPNDNENQRNNEAAKKVGVWYSNQNEILEHSKIGEGDVKIVNWAINTNTYGPVLVHANDGDIVALLCMYTCRKPVKNLVVGVMSQTYLFPMIGGDSQADNVDNKKVFNPGILSNEIYLKLNSIESAGCILPQTYFLFLIMCGNDYLESLPYVGPAKLMNVLMTRRPGLLERAVTFVPSDKRIDIEVDERAILDTIVMNYSSILSRENISPQYLAAWIRRACWTLDYNINGPLGNELLDPCERKNGLSVHGYKINESGRCVIDDEVAEPTIVNFETPTVKLSKKKTFPFTGEILDEHILEGPNKKKQRTQKAAHVSKVEEQAPIDAEQKKADDVHIFLQKNVFVNSGLDQRGKNLSFVRGSVPYGKINS